MSSRLNGFDRIARIYDALKGMVFGKAIYDSQVYFVRSIQPDGDVLIIGGGSGELLPVLLESKPGCRIWFVEASAEMLGMAMKRVPASHTAHVTFIHGTEDNLPPDLEFETVITSFFLDLFPDRKVLEISQMIASRLTPEGLWLVTDFVGPANHWQKVLLWSMYRFFAITCTIEATRLPSWTDQLAMSGMEEIASKSFYGEFIKSAVYKKSPFGSESVTGGNFDLI